MTAHTNGTIRRVTVLGCGLIGTSIALALRASGIRVALDDRDRDALAEAERMGAGGALTEITPRADVVVVAIPPSAVPGALRDAQHKGLGQVYTDVASTKSMIIERAAAAGADMATFVPGHPMAGRELQGPGAARADLFEGRRWALCPAPEALNAAVRAVAGLATICGAEPLVLPADVHDRVVAAVSHAPHVVSSALAARFANPDPAELALAGQGLRDATRIAAGPPELWRDILEQNAALVAAVLDAVAGDLTAAAAALRGAGDEALTDLLVRGNRGHARIAA